MCYRLTSSTMMVCSNQSCVRFDWLLLLKGLCAQHKNKYRISQTTKYTTTNYFLRYNDIRTITTATIEISYYSVYKVEESNGYMRLYCIRLTEFSGDYPHFSYRCI